MFCLFNCCCSWVSIIFIIIIHILIVFKLYMKLTTGVFKGYQRLDGKTVIVTGANTGIGKETALDLAHRGAKVILACRDLTKANAAKDEIKQKSGNKDVIVKKLDLSSLTSVRDFAKDIIATESHVDILINNAGATGMGNKKTEDGLLIGTQVNHFGPFLLTNLLVDLLKKSAPSRIIFVSSKAHEWAKYDVNDLNFTSNFSEMNVYSCSKLSNILNSNELATQLKETGVTVNSLHPGVVATEFSRRRPAWIRVPINFLWALVMKNPEEGAQTTIYLAVSDDVKETTGKYFADCKEVKTSALAKDSGLANKLWEKSEYFVKQK